MFKILNNLSKLTNFALVKYNYLTDENINRFITNALAEDIGDGDHTSLSSIPDTEVKKAKLLMKDNGIIAGIELATKIFKHLIQL